MEEKDLRYYAKVHSVESFGTVDGPGIRFVLFLQGCHLQCKYCHNRDTWDMKGGSYKSLDDIFNKIMNYKNYIFPNGGVTITGGEPLLYKKDLEKFIDRIYTPDKKITIETNGTLPILDPTLYRSKVALYSVSPKLSSSVGKAPGTYGSMDVTKEMIDRHNKTRINIKNLIDIVLNSNDYQFKFVYSGPGCVNEILDLYTQMDEVIQEYYSPFKYHMRHPNTHTMLMPEGINNDQLAERRKEIADICIKKGWTMTDREHIIIWGSERMR